MSSLKFNRQFVMLIEDSTGNFKQIKSPLTCEFTISRHNLASTNEAHFVIYNLNSETRNSIYKYQGDTWNKRTIMFYAGYSEKDGGLLPRCFRGQVLQCHSYREGVDFRTDIEAFEMYPGLTMDQISFKVPAGMPKSFAAKQVAEAVPDVQAVTISPTGFLDVVKKAMSFIGTPFDIIRQLTNNNVYVDSSNIYAMKPKEVVNGDIAIIDATGQNGLLGSPKRFENKVMVDMIFEPRLKPSQLMTFKVDQLVKLSARSVDQFNGSFKLTGFIHSGIISGAVNGDCRTTLTLMSLTPSGIVPDSAKSDYKAIV